MSAEILFTKIPFERFAIPSRKLKVIGIAAL